MNSTESYTHAIFNIRQLKQHIAEVIDHSRHCDREINLLEDGVKDGISLQMASHCLCGWRGELNTSNTAMGKPEVRHEF